MTRKVTRKAEDKEEGVAGSFAGVIFHNPSIQIDRANWRVSNSPAPLYRAPDTLVCPNTFFTVFGEYRGQTERPPAFQRTEIAERVGKVPEIAIESIARYLRPIVFPFLVRLNRQQV
jgi:hypothetical protein